MFVLPLARATAVRRSPALSTSFDRIVDRLFDESFDRFGGSAKTGAATRTPALDVFESDIAYTVSFDVPGATREALKVSVEGRRVTLTTAAAAAETGADAKDASTAAEASPAQRPLYRERTAPLYARTVSLPGEVDQHAAQARFENGVLTLVLAKKVASGATQLQIG
ncbi:MAG: Hsp20/alpha crystallin family protein [Caldimonas sp.]